MYIMDVPHVRNEDTKLQWRHEVHALAARIEEETGQKITEESLRAAIKLANDKRRALQRLSDLVRLIRCPSPAWTRYSLCRPPSWTTPHA